MNKGELIETIADQCDLSKSGATDVVDATLGAITGALTKGDRVQIAGFGTFEVRNRAARTARNPQTGEPIQIAATKAPAFKAGKSLKQAVNV